ncbi:MAG: DNA-directed RNA polymerase subunit omega [Lachnospiraceae bacterium]|nr:DNA-directed RNA polymerase subunit omega [Lachnospiraceae bacterium]
MLHPSYTDLMRTINSEAEGDTPTVNSRYSIVLATARRARQLIAGEEAYVSSKGKKPLSIAVEEVSKGFVTIEPETEAEETAEEPGAVEVSAEESLVEHQADTMDWEEEQ